MAKGSEATSPEQIQAEIERTRAELAATLDDLVDRVSPKRVAGRGATKVKSAVGQAVAAVHPAGQEPSGLDDAGLSEYQVQRSVRWGRVAAVGGAVALVLVVVHRRRSR